MPCTFLCHKNASKFKQTTQLHCTLYVQLDAPYVKQLLSVIRPQATENIIEHKPDSCMVEHTL